MTLEPSEPGIDVLRCSQCGHVRDCGHCTETVWHRDTFRRTGRTKSGFEMHYRRERCKRMATAGGKCWQHSGNGQ